MKGRIIICIALICALVIPAEAAPIRWVDFSVPFESLQYAMEQDIATFDQERHISWIDILHWPLAAPGENAVLPL